MSYSPVSEEIGTAPALDILMPLYWAGLWLAVKTTPAALCLPAAKYSSSVEIKPSIFTLAPR